ncbi:MAG TPA: hypothetical protein VEF53_15365 [Patescibacteria group bacterium]|nr:hypothetical protein [Patescibacteria group bacterium]
MKEYKGEFRSKDGMKTGEWKVTVDEKLKLLKHVCIDKMEIEGYQDTLNCIVNELKKFNKGEPLYLIDMSPCSTKFLTSEMMKFSNEFTAFMEPYCKKWAGVIPSFVFRKTVEIFAKGKGRYFSTEREAMDYLLKD